MVSDVGSEKLPKLRIFMVFQHPSRSSTFICSSSMGLLVLHLAKRYVRAAAINPQWGPSYVLTLDGSLLTKATVRMSEASSSTTSLPEGLVSYHCKPGRPPTPPLRSNAMTSLMRAGSSNLPYPYISQMPWCNRRIGIGC